MLYLSFYCWVLRFYSMFWIQDCCQIHELQIFSPILVWWCLLMHKFLLFFTKSNLSFFFPFAICVLVVMPKKPLPNPRSQRFTSVFHSSNLRVFTHAFRSIIYFELFLLWCETGVQIHPFVCVYLVVPATFLEENSSFLNELHSHPC